MPLLKWLYTAPLRIRSIFRRADVDRELDEELQFHLEHHIEDRIARGMTPQEARRSAMRALDGLTQRKEECRDVRRVNFIEHLVQDIRYAARTTKRSPAFAAVAVLSLALGIGSNTAIFSLVNAILVRPLPVSHPEQLVLLRPVDGGGYIGNVAYPDYQRLRDRNQIFSDVAASDHLNGADVGIGGEVQAADGEMVSGNYFDVLGVRASVGRMFTQQDEASSVVVVAYAFWQRELGGSAAVLGKTVTINGAPCSVIGVAPREFFGESAGYTANFWVPLGLQRQIHPIHDDLRSTRSVSWLDMIGRMKPGVRIEQADANVKLLVSQLQVELGINPEHDYLNHILVQPGARGMAELREQFTSPLRVLMTVVVLVLLMACTNLASLLIARSETRQREIATRLSIGASRGRVVRQLLTESCLLAAAGGVLGLLFSTWGTNVLLAMVNRNGGSIALDLRPDRNILLFAIMVTAVTGLLFGLVPAWRATGRQGARGLQLGTRVVGREPNWGLRRGLIVAQVALSMVLLAAGALFIATLRNLKTMDPGFRADHVLLVRMSPRRDGYQGPDVARLASRLLDGVSALPGVRSASVSFIGAMGQGGSHVCCLEIDGYTPASRNDQKARADWVGPDYFRTLGIPLLAGREFSANDAPGQPDVAVIDETLARHFFGDRPPVGRVFRWGKASVTIVGVVKPSKYAELREAAERTVYFPLLQHPPEMTGMQVQTTGSPIAMAAVVRQALRKVEPRLHIGEITSMPELIDRKLATEHLLANLSGFFSGLTLLLVSIGIFGTLSYSVARRTNEIGIRMALGAQSGTVLRLVLGEIATMLVCGAAIGVAVVVAFGRVIASLLFGLKAADVPTIGIAVAVLSAVSFAAAYIPARRASRVDPVTALRCE